VPDFDKTRFFIEPLGKHHDRAAFSCGHEALDRYLRETVGQDIKKKSAIAYVLTDDNHVKIVGYYTLAASSAPLGEFPPEVAKELPKYPNVPVTLIGRMAINRSDQGRGHGESLLMDACRISYENSLRVASAAIVVDAKDDKSAAFYHGFGFISMEERPRRLFIPMKTIEILCN
jgi:predicted GNAT family N-acyltransferase